MTRVSSQWTFFCKRVIPFGFYALIAVHTSVAVGLAFAQRELEDLLLIPFAAVFAFVVHAIFGRYLFDLVDEVWDEGDRLTIVNGRRVCHVLVKDCANVIYNGTMNPPRITLTLRRPCDFGLEISFIPLMRMSRRPAPPFATDLMSRIDNLKIK